MFGLEEGKLLGDIILKDDIKIDPNRVSAIQKMDIPRSKKEIQSFLGRIDFFIRFIPNLVEISRKITDMLKWDNEVKWVEDSRKYFNEIKATLSRAPTLASLDYTREFIVFFFAFEHSIIAVLL